MSPRSFADVKSISTIVVAVLALSVFCGKVVAQAGCDKQTAICVTTQGDSATPIAIPNPVIKQNKVASKIDIGPLSPIESCSLTSVTSTPSTTTDQASLARLIGILLGTTIAAPTVPAGPFYSVTPTHPNIVPPPGGKKSASELLNKIDDELKEAGINFAKWIKRRKVAVDSINQNQRLLTVAARFPSPDAPTNNMGIKDQLKSWANCLNEEASDCSNVEAITAGSKLSYENELQEISSNLSAVSDLLKATPNEADQKRLYDDQAKLAELQNDDTKLRAGEAALATIYAQVFKVSQHINASTMRDGPSGLYESLTLTPGKDSDLAASVTCTSLVDNTTTLGPVPVTIHAGVPHLVFSAGGVISLTPTQTLGVVPVHDNSTATFHNVIAQTGHNNFQVIPFAFETFRFMPWRARRWDTAGFRGFGVTGGIGYNAYSGVNGIDFFAGGSVRVMDKVYVHIGSHFGRYTRLDPHSSYDIGQTVPSSGFPSTVPTVTHFTGHLAFGASYSF